MNTLVRDLKTHPLVPGSVLAAVIGDPGTRRIHPLEHAGLVLFNKQNTLEVVAYFQELGLIETAAAERVLSVDAGYLNAFKVILS